jgi:hypothetical protein
MKKLIFCILKITEDLGDLGTDLRLDPEMHPHPFQFVRGTVRVRIRIHTKMARIRNTVNKTLFFGDSSILLRFVQYFFLLSCKTYLKDLPTYRLHLRLRTITEELFAYALLF